VLFTLMFFELSPLAIAVFTRGAPQWIAVATLLIATAREFAVARWMRRPLLPAVFAPIGLMMMYVGALRGMILTLRRDGIEWRGTRYPLAALRRGRRFQWV